MQRERVTRVTLALACAVMALGANAHGESEATGDRDAAVSLLAVGDTGNRYALPWLRAGQRSVARGLRHEDRRAPVDALVLLGDLFYPNGLERAELARRVRDDLVTPFCHFARLDGPRSREVSDACPAPAAERHAIPILAVPGNHDYKAPESLELERHSIPQFITNWSLHAGLARTVELGSGVSLVLIDSVELIRTGDYKAVRSALRRAQGPWRIVAAHLPVAPGDPIADREWRSTTPPIDHFRIPEAPIHLYLAGHRHNLQVIEGRPPEPALHVIAGSGSNVRPVRMRYANRAFALERTGFARVDLVGRDDDARLLVRLFTMPRHPIAFWARPREVTRWSIDSAGRVRELSIAAR